jgi:hypothetical protein
MIEQLKHHVKNLHQGLIDEEAARIELAHSQDIGDRMIPPILVQTGGMTNKQLQEQLARLPDDAEIKLQHTEYTSTEAGTGLEDLCERNLKTVYAAEDRIILMPEDDEI